MSSWTWAFVRGTHRLELRQGETPEGYLLQVTCDGTPRSYEFPSFQVFTRFQSDMEAFLLKTGWTFVTFSPDRRRGRDRRTFPRPDERRRWWTDATGDKKKVVWG